MRQNFPMVGLQDLVNTPNHPSVRARALAPAEYVALPPLPTGQFQLAQMDVPTEPGGAHWTADHYWSVAPVLIEFHDVLVHSSAGIVCAGGGLVTNTLHQANMRDEGWARLDDNMAALDLADDITRLPGRHLSLLTGNAENYYHWMMDGIGRLAATDPSEIATLDGVLHPACTLPIHQDSLRRLGLTLPAHPVPRGATLWLETLVVPWSALGEHRPHPSMTELFARLGANPPPAPAPGLYPRRLYIDRSGQMNRKLVNEPDVKAALAAVGFVAVQPERLALSAQIALFANADIIVAPHGAALTSIVFCRPGTALIELHMNSWVMWNFRRFAAIGGMRYDCVIGQDDQPPGTPPSNWPHPYTWEVSIPAVLAAVDFATRGA